MSTFENLIAVLGVVLMSIVLNWFLFGVLTQQFYSYCIGGFKDPRRTKAFVIVQYGIATVQCVVLCHLAWNLYVVGYCDSPSFRSYTWQRPVSSVSQCVLILMANMFFAHRIYSLTESQLQRGTIIVLSAAAFVFGLCALILPWTSSNETFTYTHFTPAENATMAVWHVLQSICECLISGFLIRALLRLRTGVEKSDNLVHYLTRRVIQLGLFAVIWTLAGLATWFLKPKYTIYTIFDTTVGSVYTHMVYDTLLSRTRPGERMTESSKLEMGLPSTLQLRTRKSEGPPPQGSLQVPHGTPSVLGFSTANASTLISVTKEISSDFECVPVGQEGVPYEATYGHQ